jgi:uncharacterized protein (DUF1499 family)
MARRRRFEEPTSRLAVWALRLVLFALAVTLLVVLAVRLDFVEVLPGVVTLAATLLIAVIALGLAIGAFVIIWREGVKGFRYALLAFFIGILLLVYPIYLAASSYGLPPINDITTDTADPPRFEAIARLRPREANPVAYPGASAAAQQRAAYPDLKPLQLSTSAQEAYDIVLTVVTRRKWRVVDARPPQSGRREGRVEAVARTPIMGFRDDVVVRVRATGEGARVDIRSASRYGLRDFGTNAQRVKSLLEEIEEAASAQTAASR